MRFHVVLYIAHKLASENRNAIPYERHACYLAMMHRAGHDGDRLVLAIFGERRRKREMFSILLVVFFISLVLVTCKSLRLSFCPQFPAVRMFYLTTQISGRKYEINR